MIKEYLRSVRKLYLEIEVKERRRDRLRSIVSGSNIRMKQIDVQTSIAGDRFGDTMAEMADLDRAIEENIKTLRRMQDEAEAMFSRLSKPEYRAIMTDYYLNAYTWDKVAEYNGYSTQAVYKIHGLALLELEKMKSRVK